MAPLPQEDGVALDRDLAGKAAVHEVVAQQVRIGLDRRQIVYGDDFDIVAVGFDDGTQNIAADAAKPVDGNANRHLISRSPFAAGRNHAAAALIM